MSYLIFVFFLCLMLALIWVAVNPSPYFGAVGLVGASVVGCGILVGVGYSFVSLVLFLIYLGGMLVVFAYTASLAAEPYPEVVGDRMNYFWGYMGLFVLVGVFMIEEGVSGVEIEIHTLSGLSMVSMDLIGVPLLYSWGGFNLLICGWALLLVLFVVLELIRGMYRGGLRSV